MKFSSPMNANVNYILNLELTCGILLCCHHYTTHHNGQSLHQRCKSHNPHHHHRIGLTLLGQVAEGTRFHKQLPFGLALATAIFSTLAKALEWVLQHRSLSKLWSRSRMVGELSLLAVHVPHPGGSCQHVYTAGPKHLGTYLHLP